MTTQEPSATGLLGSFGVAHETDAIPQDVLHQSARVLFDTLSCAVSGAATPSLRIVRDSLLDAGGTPESWVAGTTTRVPAPMAAFVNALAANALDFDDNLLYFSHIANTVVAAAVAIAERVDATGRELLAAVAVGYEITARAALSVPGVLDVGDGDERPEWPNPWGHSYNLLGAAVAAARLLGCDPEQSVNALGLAAYSAPMPSLTKYHYLDHPPLSKYNAYGQQAMAACQAGLLARNGYTGDPTALDGPHGFWKMMGATRCDFNLLTRDLGSSWWIMQTSFKLVPAGTWMRPALRALDVVMTDPRYRPEIVDEIEVFTAPLSERGAHVQQNVETYLDTQTSYHYLMAVAAARVAPELWQAEETFLEPLVRTLTSRVSLHRHPRAEATLLQDLRTSPHRAFGAEALVRVRLSTGVTLEAESRYGDGDPFDDATRIRDEALNEKFRRFAAPLLPEARRDDAEARIWDLENDDCSARQLMESWTN